MKMMRTIVVAIFVGAIVVGAGCVSTVNDRKTAGVPFIKDRVEGRYERPLDQVFQAAKAVVKKNGVLINESTLYGEANAVKTVEGKVNERNVWVRVEAVDPKTTAVVVQTRTSAGGSDIDLAHELEKEIALELK